GANEGPAGGGSYANSSSGALSSPIIDLSGLTGAITLNFNYFLNANTGILGTFDQATVTVVSGATRIGIANNSARGALGNTAAFTPISLDLTRFAGQQIRLEFGFQADGDARIGEGWYVDDVVVTAQSTDVATV